MVSSVIKAAHSNDVLSISPVTRIPEGISADELDMIANKSWYNDYVANFVPPGSQWLIVHLIGYGFRRNFEYTDIPAYILHIRDPPEGTFKSDICLIGKCIQLPVHCLHGWEITVRQWEDEVQVHFSGESRQSPVYVLRDSERLHVDEEWITLVGGDILEIGHPDGSDTLRFEMSFFTPSDPKDRSSPPPPESLSRRAETSSSTARVPASYKVEPSGADQVHNKELGSHSGQRLNLLAALALPSLSQTKAEIRLSPTLSPVVQSSAKLARVSAAQHSAWTHGIECKREIPEKATLFGQPLPPPDPSKFHSDTSNWSKVASRSLNRDATFMKPQTTSMSMNGRMRSSLGNGRGRAMADITVTASGNSVESIEEGKKHLPKKTLDSNLDPLRDSRKKVSAAPLSSSKTQSVTRPDRANSTRTPAVQSTKVRAADGTPGKQEKQSQRATMLSHPAPSTTLGTGVDAPNLNGGVNLKNMRFIKNKKPEDEASPRELQSAMLNQSIGATMRQYAPPQAHSGAVHDVIMKERHRKDLEKETAQFQWKIANPTRIDYSKQEGKIRGQHSYYSEPDWD